MKVIKNTIDSIVYGRTFLEIVEYSSGLDFNQFENDYLKEFDPFYVSCKIPIEDIGLIQSLERNRFSFIEFQIREVLRLKKKYFLPGIENYQLQLVTENDLEEVLNIAENTFEHDRFTIDPEISKSFSGKRYRAYVRKSFETDGEFLYKLINKETGEMLGFKSHKIISKDEVLMFLGGIVNKYKQTPIPVINAYLELNELFDKGIKKVTTNISGSNYGVLNLEVKLLDYKVAKAFVVLRKIYAGSYHSK